MRIAYCYPEILPSRMARSIQVINTCVALAAECEQLFLYLPKAKCRVDDIFSFYGLSCPANLTVRFLRKSIGPFSSHKLYNLGLQSLLKKDKPDVIFSRHLKTADFLLGQGIPFLYEAHEIFSEKKRASAYDKICEERVLQNADGVIFISRGLQRAMVKQYGCPSLKTIIPNSANRIPSLTEKKVEKGGLNRFVYIGTTRYGWKGVDVLVQALEILPKQYYLEIAGELDEKFRNQESVTSLLNQGRLISRGYIHPSEVFCFMKEAQVAVIPNSARDSQSANFTCPLKLIEAMAAGVAVVVSDLPSIREIVSDKEAVLVKPDDPVALAEGIRTILEDHLLRQRLAKNAWLRAQSYSWQSRAGKIIDLAEKVLSHATI